MAPPIDTARFEQLKASGDLPSPRGVALALINLTRRDDVPTQEFVRVLRGDQALVAKVIKVANGVVGYRSRPIVSVSEALTVLGVSALRNTVLGLSLLDHYRKGMCEGFDYGRFWGAAIFCASACQALSAHVRIVPADEIYSVGLLKTVGELALATLYPHEYSRILMDSAGDQRKRLGLELDSFFVSSAELGAAMLADWGVPRLFCEAVFCANCGLPARDVGGRGEALCQLLKLAAQMAAIHAMPPESTEDALVVLCQDARMLGLDDAATRSVFEQSTAACNEWLEFVGIPHARDGMAPVALPGLKLTQDDA